MMTLNLSQYSFKDLDQILTEIPEKTVFKGSNKARFKTLTFAVVSLFIAIAAYMQHLKTGHSMTLTWIFAAIFVLFIILTKVKWNDGNIDIIEFTHQHLRIKDVNYPIPLDAITEYSYKYDNYDTLILTIDKPIEGLELNSKTQGAIGASVVIAQKASQQMIKIIVPYSFTLDGKRLFPEECTRIIESYLSIPEIKRQMIMVN